MATLQQKKEYLEKGYFVVRDAVSEEMLERLEAASKRALSKVRLGQVAVEKGRVCVNVHGSDTEHIEGILAPEFDESVFAEYLCSAPLLNYVKAFLGDELRLGWITLCVNGSGYDSGWHRDFGDEERDGSYEVEMEILKRNKKNHIKWSLALHDDPCLLLVPGSQRRYRTDEEREGLINTRFVDISGQKEIFLEKGQTLFWNGNTIHRGRAPSGFGSRLTVRAGMAQFQENEGVEDLGARFCWMQASNVRDRLPDKLLPLYDRWLDVQPNND